VRCLPTTSTTVAPFFERPVALIDSATVSTEISVKVMKIATIVVRPLDANGRKLRARKITG
jgi:hypothetical protein